jgi:hypothetical protein
MDPRARRRMKIIIPHSVMVGTDAKGTGARLFVTVEENSEVFPLGSVTVAVRFPPVPPGGAKPLKVNVPSITVAEPMKILP